MITLLSQHKPLSTSRYLVQIQGVTERKLAELSLQVNEKKYLTLDNNFPIDLCQTAPEGNFFIQLLGVSSKFSIDFYSFCQTLN